MISCPKILHYERQSFKEQGQ